VLLVLRVQAPALVPVLVPVLALLGMRVLLQQ
jgi:hypothetical protein